MNTPLVVENRDWIELGAVLDTGRDGVMEARVRLDALGARLRRDLGLRMHPFLFRGGNEEPIEMKVIGIAGTISVGGLVIDVAPKFAVRTGGQPNWSASMLLLMQQARRRDSAFFRSTQRAIARHNIVDLLAMAFGDAAEAGLADQAIQTYRTRSETHAVLRGRLDLPRQLKSVFSRPHLVECEVDQLDVDNDFNGLLKWAAETFMSMVRLPALKRRMSDLAFRIPGRPHWRRGFHGRQLHLPPQFRVWSEALDIAAMLASGLTQTTGTGSHDGYSFVFNMERLFEHFVESRVRRVAADAGDQGISWERQVSTPYAKPHLRTNTRFFSKPDNVLTRGGNALVVVDAKYKRLSDDRGLDLRKPVSADLYELVAAMTAQGCTAGMLVYPRVLGDEELLDDRLRIWVVDGFGTRLFLGALALDLTALQSYADLQAIDAHLSDGIRSLLSADGDLQ